MAYEGVSQILRNRWIGLRWEKALTEESLNGRAFDSKKSGRRPGTVRATVKEMKIESEVIVPMSFGGRVVGTIWIAQRRPRDF